MTFWLNNTTIFLWALTKFLGLVFLDLLLLAAILAIFVVLTANREEKERWK